jgi:hypothetical protein
MIDYRMMLHDIRSKGVAPQGATLDAVKPAATPEVPEVPLAEPVVTEPVTTLDNAAEPTPTEPTPAADPAAGAPAGDPAPVLDGVVVEPEPAPTPEGKPIYDAAGTALFVDDVVGTDLDITAAAIVQEWAETLPEDLDDGEGPADRLLALMIGAMPEDEFPDVISDDAADDLMDLGDAVGDVLADLGVADEDLDILLNDFDNDVGERVQELIAGSLAEGADPVTFVLGDGSDEPAFDAVYRRRIAVRGGKKVRINKRVSGRVVLSGAQKASVRKMQLKARTSMAKLRRAKSMRVRQRMGL